jgi:hypothetical protein
LRRLSLPITVATGFPGGLEPAMTNKFIVSTVDCINEFASDVPQSVSLRIDTMLEQRIRKLAAYVKENDLHLTEFYFYEALLNKSNFC